MPSNSSWFLPFATAVALSSTLAACSATSTLDDGGADGSADGASDGARAEASSPDASAPNDGSAQPDGATMPDATVTGDASDASAASDASDASAPSDSGAGMDASAPDASAPDASAPDSGVACMPQSCYSGPAATAGRGECRAGARMCIGGTLGVCTGEITPTSEACNGRDDDCDGMTDNLPDVSCGVGACRVTVRACTMGAPSVCAPRAPGAEMCGNMIDDDCNGVVDDGCACVYVATTGADSNTGSASSPLRNIQTAINRAGTMGLPNSVCVAGGTYAEDITMRDGISVRGGYQAGATWTRPGSTTTINASGANANGLVFPASVRTATVLDGFVVNGATANTSVGLTVNGATNAIISNNAINGRGSADSVGVNVVNMGATRASVTLTANTIVGGSDATRSTIGVRSTSSTVVIGDHCQTFASNGRCTSSCGGGRGIRGRTAPSIASVESYGVLLDDSPNSIIDRSAICSGAGNDAAGVRVRNDGAAIRITQSNIQAYGATLNSVGVWVSDCRGASPLIAANTMISGGSNVAGSRGDGVRSVGDCHAVVANNNQIVGGLESANNLATGVFCTANGAGVASRCTVLNNERIAGSGGGVPPAATGVRCAANSCVRIEGNQLITGNSAANASGVTIEGASPVIRQNTIEAGCARTIGIGLQLTNTAARVENNVVYGGRCNNSGGAPITPNRSDAVRIVSTGLAEPDIHSNDIFGEGSTMVGAACTSRGIAVEANDSVPPGSRGVVRNNIVHPGRCMTRAAIAEGHRLADLRLLENNDLWFEAMGDTLYFDENMTAITSLATVNALSNPSAAANLSADPRFVSATNVRLQMGSPCVNAGTSAGAPTVDFFSVARPSSGGYEIGASEQ